jgi:hypothetical protein
MGSPETRSNSATRHATCFTYGGSAGPHALSSIAGTYNGVANPSFTYDVNGNMLSGAGRTMTTMSFNMAATIGINPQTGVICVHTSSGSVAPLN